MSAPAPGPPAAARHLAKGWNSWETPDRAEGFPDRDSVHGGHAASGFLSPPAGPGGGTGGVGGGAGGLAVGAGREQPLVGCCPGSLAGYLRATSEGARESSGWRRNARPGAG